MKFRKFDVVKGSQKQEQLDSNRPCLLPPHLSFPSKNKNTGKRFTDSRPLRRLPISIVKMIISMITLLGIYIATLVPSEVYADCLVGDIMYVEGQSTGE